MSTTYRYSVSYSGDWSHISIPELEGQPVKKMQGGFLYEDDVLDIMHFRYEVYCNDFTKISVQKTGGSGETARGDEYYEMLTEEEADFIVKYVLKRTLGIEDADVKTDSDDLIPYNDVEDEYDDEWDEEEEDC